MKKKLMSIITLILAMSLVFTSCTTKDDSSSKSDDPFNQSSGESSSVGSSLPETSSSAPEANELKEGNIYKEILGLRFQYSEDYITTENNGFQYIYINDKGSFIMAYSIENAMDFTKSFATLYFTEELKGFNAPDNGWKDGALSDEIEEVEIAGVKGFKTSFTSESVPSGIKFKIAVRSISHKGNIISFFLLSEESNYEDDLVVFEEFVDSIEITPAD